MGKRRKSRETAIQMLYQIEIMHQSCEDGVRLFLSNFSVEDDVVNYARELVYGVHENLSEIDCVIKKFSEHWKIGRMTSVDRNILRLAIFEIMHKTDIPEKVCINEALEIAKKYSSNDSSAFINGILDAIIKSEQLVKKKNES